MYLLYTNIPIYLSILTCLGVLFIFTSWHGCSRKVSGRVAWSCWKVAIICLSLGAVSAIKAELKEGIFELTETRTKRGARIVKLGTQKCGNKGLGWRSHLDLLIWPFSWEKWLCIYNLSSTLHNKKPLVIPELTKFLRGARGRSLLKVKNNKFWKFLNYCKMREN